MSIKIKLLRQAIAHLEAQIATAEQGRQGAIEESKAHKGAMASRYDTFKEEAQYLAGGFNARIQELSGQLVALKTFENSIATNDTVSLGAIVKVENVDNTETTRYFILPADGGSAYEESGHRYVVLTPKTPLARALFGKVAGDDAEFAHKNTVKHLLVMSIV